MVDRRHTYHNTPGFCGLKKTKPFVHLLCFDEVKRDVGTQERKTDYGDQCHEQKDKVQALAVLHRQGMMKRNIQIIAEGGKSEDFVCERELNGPKETCSGCNGVFKTQLQACKGMPGKCYNSSANGVPSLLVDRNYAIPQTGSSIVPVCLHVYARLSC